MRGLDFHGDEITSVLLRLSEAHAKSRDLRLPKVVAKDIVPSVMQGGCDHEARR